MSEPVQTTPSLLTLTAPQPSRKNDASAPHAGFENELNTAVEAAKPKAKPESSDAEKPATEKENTPVGSIESSDSTAVEGPAVAEEDPDTEETLLDDIDPQAVELLATVVATETIVLETAPGTVLPDEAITSLDVDAASEANPETSLTPSEVNATDNFFFGTDPDGAGTLEESAAAATPGLDGAETLESSTATGVASNLPATNAETAAPEGDAVAISTEPGATTAAAVAAADAASEDAPLNKPVVEPATEKSEAPSEVAPKGDEAVEPEPTTPQPVVAAASVSGPQERSDDATDPSEGKTETDNNARDVDGPRQPGRAAATARPESTESAPAIDPSRFVSRVARAIDSAQQRGGGPIEMRLSPPELGSLQVKIEVHEGVMTAKLEVETPAARNALLDNLPALRDRLEQQQIRIDKFDVEVRDDQQQRGGDWRQQQDNQQRADQRQNRPDTRPAARVETAPQQAAEPAATRTITFSNNGINLVA